MTQETLLEALDSAVAARPDERFLDFSGVGMTYGAFDLEVGRLAAGLHRLGVRSGDVVATLLDNGPEPLVAWFAANRLGAVASPLNTALRGDFLRHQLDDAGARVVIAEPDYAGRVLALADELVARPTVLVTGAGPLPSSSLAIDHLEAARSGGVAGAWDGRGSVGDLALLMYTSGTTGRSKGCMIDHGYVLNMARQGLAATQRSRDELHWTALPLFHVNPLATAVSATILLQGTVSIAPRFSLSGFWPEILRSGARIATVLGSMVTLIASMEDTEEMALCRGQLRVARGAPFPPEMQRLWRDRFGVEAAGSAAFGMTEASLIASTPYGVEAPPGSVGRENESFGLAVLGDDGQNVTAGEVGEIAIRQKRQHIMFRGYWKLPATVVPDDPEWWYRTGDLGRMDADGWLYFVDRKADYVRRRGENVSTYELEAVLAHHPDILDVDVCGVPSPLGEEDIKVTGVVGPGSTLRPEELCRWVVPKVPYFAVPRYVELRDDVPRNPAGKILKFELRAEGVTAGTWDREADPTFVVDKR